MIDESQVAEELYAFAGALVGKVARRRRGEHWKEDAIQDLVLAGLQDYRDTGNIGLAKNRMVSRQKNLLRDDYLERKHEPKPESDFAPQSPSGRMMTTTNHGAFSKREPAATTPWRRRW